MPKSRRSSMQQAMLNMNKHIYSDEVRLMMECTEEDLLPCQRLSYKSALDEYNRVNKYIADVQTGKIQMTNVPNSTISLVTDPNAVVRPKQAQKSNQSNDPDVIVIGESPAQQKKGGQNIPALPNVDVSLPALPDNISGQQIITFPQQVYNQFVNGQQSNVVKVGNQIFIRPIMSVAPQQNGAQGVSYSVNNPSMVRPTSLLKRQTEIDADYKKRLLASKNEMDSSGNWVPLDEFYYGKKEGDPTYVEDKGEYRFKCWYCSKMLYNNVKIMMHMQGHIDSEKQHNLDLSDLTQCKHCYKQFDTPFEMQTHIEKVHMYNSNVLMCRICEKDCDSRMTLTSHMRTNHNACEMPYICHLCGFRSSMYSDVVDHFKKKHDSSANLLCLYCLKAFNIKFISTGWGQTQNYYHHLLKHQAKNKVKKCQVCKLTFFNPADLKSHRQKDHLANVKGVIGMNSKYTTPDQVMIKVPEQGLQPKPIKSLNAPTVSKVRDNHLLLPRVVNDADCLECKTNMSSVEHFKKYIQCSMCRFATSCSFAYANHMMGFHSGKMTTLSLNIPQEKPMEHVMYCMCGYASLYGNKIANHMVYCTKRTCYKDKPDVQIQEYDNKEMQDPRKKPGASLLDVLGLVKKPSSGEGDDINESNEDIEGDDDKLREGGSTSSDSQGKKSTDWFKIKLSDSSTTDSQEVEKEDDNVNKGDVVEIPDEPSIMDKTDLNSAKSNEDNNEDDGGGEDVLGEKSVSDNVKNNSEDITEVFNDSLTDSTLKIKDIESLKTNVDQSDDSTDKTEGKSEEKESQEDKSSADSEVSMETSIDQPEIQEKDNLVIERKNHDLSDGSTEDQTKSENSSESIHQKEAPSSTFNSDDGEFISKEPKDMPDEVSAIEADDISTSDNIQIPYTDNKTESSSVVTEKSTENKEDKVSQSEVPLNEASTHSIGTSEDKEVNISPTTEESILETSSQDKPIDGQITDDSTKHFDIVDTIDKPSINETSLEISLEELHPTTESFKQESKTETPTDNVEKSTIQTESAFHSSEEQLMEGTNFDTESQHHTDENPTKTLPDHSESSSFQANNPPQQQNQKDTSAESSDKPEDNSSSQRYDDSHNRRYSDEHNRAFDRERSNREHRDRDRSYQHRNDYRDRSRDYHYDRDRKYDRDYDRHGRDRNRDYGYHGSHSRDHRRDGYRERDRDRDYDNRNYNRRGGNYRGRSGYY